jgi:hypothetical protein
MSDENLGPIIILSDGSQFIADEKSIKIYREKYFFRAITDSLSAANFKYEQAEIAFIIAKINKESIEKHLQIYEALGKEDLL